MALQESEPQRLTPAMRSRKLQALDFIKRYYAQWGRSPTLGELSAHLQVSTKRAHDLVDQLAHEQMVEREAGKTRGIRLIDRGEELSEADVLLRLSAMGWTIGQGFKVILPPGCAADAGIGAAIVRGLMEKGLPGLDFISDDDGEATGAIIDGEANKACTGTRAATTTRGAAGGEQNGLGQASS